MSLYQKCFLRVCYNCVPNFMLVSSKHKTTRIFHRSAGLETDTDRRRISLELSKMSHPLENPSQHTSSPIPPSLIDEYGHLRKWSKAPRLTNSAYRHNDHCRQMSQLCDWSPVTWSTRRCPVETPSWGTSTTICSWRKFFVHSVSAKESPSDDVFNHDEADITIVKGGNCD